jgi:hypothetical protein
MTALRILNVLAWGALALYMLPGAWSAAKGTMTRHGDPMRLSVLATALIMVGFTLRWLLAPGSDALWRMLYLLSIADAAYIAYLARAYGRGERA